jgi:tRNA modification GTPase
MKGIITKNLSQNPLRRPEAEREDGGQGATTRQCNEKALSRRSNVAPRLRSRPKPGWGSGIDSKGEDTICAIASPRGQAIRGIVRLSGDHAAEVASKCLDRPVSKETFVMQAAEFALPDTGPFPVTVYVMRSPRSYTREDVVEIHAPGSPPLLAAIMAELCRHGARPAEPGEFTKRAFLNGRIDLAQAEAILALIRARSDDEERLALSALSGNLSDEVKAIRGRLMDLVVDMEAGLDFHEDEIVFATPERQREGIAEAANAVRALLDASAARSVYREEVLAVLYGPVNAGKSSLFNMLAGAEKAIVHQTPGTTRDTLEAAVKIGGVSFLLVDTAGVRPPAETIEEMAVARSKRFAREAEVTLFVIDASEPLSGQVAALYEDIRQRPHVVVLNKADLPLAVDRKAWLERFCDARVVEVSAESGAGRLALEDALTEAVVGGQVDLSTMRFYLAGRQRRLLEEAFDALGRAGLAAGNVAQTGGAEEIVALELREAVEALGRITGEDYVGDLLDEVFSRFCLGK